MSQQGLEAYTKADISFYRGYIEYRTNQRKSIFIHLFQIIMFAIIIPIDCVILQLGDKMPIAFGIAAADSLISLLIILYLYYNNFAKNTVVNYCIVARNTLHTTAQPILSLNQLEQCTSETVLHSHSEVQVAGVPQKTIEIYGTIARQQIEHYIQLNNPHLAWWDRAYNFLSLITMLIVIIMLGTSQKLNPLEIVVFIIFLLLEAYIKFKIIFILFLIAISPILCIIAIIVACCCRPKDSTFAINLKSRPAQMKQVLLCDGQCAICLQDITLKEDIYQLSCSQKHIFHAGCLNSWTKVKTSCPICRKQIAVTQVELKNQPPQ